jgi:uncharacterized membrane protein YuzA (DUF378 family)
MTIREESERLVALFTARPSDLVSYLSGQLSVVKAQAHMLVGLCGLSITVTGFSGSHMIRAGTLSSGALVVGIAFILVAAVLCLQVLTRLRWVSQDLSDDLVQTTMSVISRRNRQQRRVAVAGALVTIGLGSYLLSVALAALRVGS